MSYDDRLKLNVRRCEKRAEFAGRVLVFDFVAVSGDKLGSIEMIELLSICYKVFQMNWENVCEGKNMYPTIFFCIKTALRGAYIASLRQAFRSFKYRGTCYCTCYSFFNWNGSMLTIFCSVNFYSCSQRKA